MIGLILDIMSYIENAVFIKNKISASFKIYK